MSTIINKPGVYLIRNIVNNKVYVGSATKNMRTRWFRHRTLLRAGKHHNLHLQSAWNKYDEGSFEFSVILQCKPEDCISLEQWWINELCAADNKYGYNISPTAGSCFGVTHTNETKKRMSEAHKGRKKSPEHVAKVTAANRGLKRSAESRAKMSAAKKGKPLPNGILAKAITANTGRPLSNEHKAKLSSAALGRSSECYKKMWETRRANKLAINVIALRSMHDTPPPARKFRGMS